MRYLSDVVRGLLMGSVYVVPGGDGGTVALVLGIYERLIRSLHAGAAALGHFLRGRFRAGTRRLGDVEWHFLIPLGIGILIAGVTVASVIDDLLHDHPVATSAAFVGLVLGAVVIAWRLVTLWTPARIGLLIGTAVLIFLALGFRPAEFEDPALIFFFGAGVVSLVALILPGFSGATALITIGMYQPFLDAVTDREWAAIVAFLLGGVLCLAAVSTLLDSLLRTRHDAVVAVLIGLMVGSLRTLWPWQDDTGTMLAPSDWLEPLLLALAGFAVVAGIGWWATRKSSVVSHQSSAHSQTVDD